MIYNLHPHRYQRQVLRLPIPTLSRTHTTHLLLVGCLLTCTRLPTLIHITPFTICNIPSMLVTLVTLPPLRMHGQQQVSLTL